MPAPVCNIVNRYRGVLDVRETIKKRALQADDGQLNEILTQNKSGKNAIKLTVTGNTDNAIKAAFSDRSNFIYVNTTMSLINEDLEPEERPEDKEAADNIIIKEVIFAVSKPDENESENYGHICQIAKELGTLKGERIFTLAGSTVIYNTTEHINQTFPLNDDQEVRVL